MGIIILVAFIVVDIMVFDKVGKKIFFPNTKKNNKRRNK